jgi:hypothetical protein
MNAALMSIATRPNAEAGETRERLEEAARESGIALTLRASRRALKRVAKRE